MKNLHMRMRIIPKESTTPRCHELVLSENCTTIEGEDHPLIKMVVNCVLVDGLYLLVTTMVDLSMEVVKGLQEVAITIL